MAKPLSFDLRSHVLTAIDGGLSCQRVERDPVGRGSSNRGRHASQAPGRRSPVHRTEAHAVLIHAALIEPSDITLPELKEKLAARGVHVSVAALWRFCKRHKISRKKDGPPRLGTESARHPDAAPGMV